MNCSSIRAAIRIIVVQERTFCSRIEEPGVMEFSIESLFDSQSVPYSLVLAAIFLVVSIVYINETVYRMKRRTADIPAYKNWPIVGDALHFKRDQSEFYLQVMDLFSKWRENGHRIGKFTFGPYVIICIFKPEEIEKILSSYDFLEKSDDYDCLHKWLGTGLLTSTGSKWHHRRKLLTPSFHFNILQDFLDIMNEHSVMLRDELLHKLSTFKPGEVDSFDIFPYITLNSLDIISETAMGVKLDALHDSESPYVKAVFLVKEETSIRQRSPWYWSDFVYDKLPVGRRVNEAIKYMHEFSLNVIKERSELKKSLDTDSTVYRKKRAFLDTLLDCDLTHSDIREEVDTFMFEGHDTVSSASAHLIHLLGAHPDVQKLCQSELDQIVPNSLHPNMSQLRQLHYLEACIKETLRMFPSVPWFARRLSRDTELAGHVIPASTSVIMFCSVMHMDPEIYPDPKKFKPERWLDTEKNRHPFSFIPFSAGPRNCIGQKFAMMELKVTASILLRNFNITSTQRTEDLRPSPGLILQPTSGITVKLTPR